MSDCRVPSTAVAESGSRTGCRAGLRALLAGMMTVAAVGVASLPQAQAVGPCTPEYAAWADGYCCSHYQGRLGVCSAGDGFTCVNLGSCQVC